jgi:hypothetical protein
VGEVRRDDGEFLDAEVATVTAKSQSYLPVWPDEDVALGEVAVMSTVGSAARSTAATVASARSTCWCRSAVRTRARRWASGARSVIAQGACLHASLVSPERDAVHLHRAGSDFRVCSGMAKDLGELGFVRRSAPVVDRAAGAGSP